MARISDKDEINKIARNIARLLRERDRTQADLARHLKVSEQAVTHWVNGRNAPGIANIQRISDWFGVGMMDILEGPQKPSSYQRAWLMDKAANASDEEISKIAKFWEQMDKESEGHW